jgi:proline iminopeptidase
MILSEGRAYRGLRISEPRNVAAFSCVWVLPGGSMDLGEGYLSVGQGVRLFYQKVGDGPRAVLIANGLALFDDFRRFASPERTLLFVDLRRGRSQIGDDPQALVGGIQRDVEDFEAVRAHFGFDQLALIGHSYCGVTVVSYAVQHPERASRVVQLGPTPPVWGKQYPAPLSNLDATFTAVMAGLAQLEATRGPGTDPELHCREFMALLRPLYVLDAKNADQVRWDPCEWPNERGFLAAMTEHIAPSMARVDLAGAARLATPVLTVHAPEDRSTPYGGGREWAQLLGNARLLTVERAGHMPWIEHPAQVFAAIDGFLAGSWPAGAEMVADDRAWPKSPHQRGTEIRSSSQRAAAAGDCFSDSRSTR